MPALRMMSASLMAAGSGVSSSIHLSHIHEVISSICSLNGLDGITTKPLEKSD